MRKPFDLNYYLEHPETKVVTRGGNNARILCTDFKCGCYTIVAAYINSKDNLEYANVYTSNGFLIEDKEYDCDLFFEVPDIIIKRIPLTHDDFVERISEGKTMWITIDGENEVIWQIVGVDKDEGYVYVADQQSPYSYKELMTMNYYFIDGTPCWKEVEA